MALKQIINGVVSEMTSEEEAAYLASLPVPTLGDFRRAIQEKVDATARDRDYDSGVACACWATSTVPQWAAEAGAFIAWRDQVWAQVYAEWAKVETGERPFPTLEEIVAELPEIVWPS